MRRWWVPRDWTWVAFLTVLVLPLLGHAALTAAHWLWLPARGVRPTRAGGSSQWRLRAPSGPASASAERAEPASALWTAVSGGGPEATAGSPTRLRAGFDGPGARAGHWVRALCSAALAHELTVRRYAGRHLALRDASLVVTGADQARFVDVSSPAGVAPLQGDAASLLTLGSPLCLVGEPRSGPSRVLERLFWAACEHAARSPRGARLPVLLDLAQVAIPAAVGEQDLGAWLYRRVRAEAEGAAVYRLRQCFDASARGAGLLVLLDGLGGPAPAHSARTWAAVARMARGLGRMSRDNVLVVTLSPTRLAELAVVPDSVAAYRRLMVVEPAEAPHPHEPATLAQPSDTSGAAGPLPLPPGEAAARP